MNNAVCQILEARTGQNAAVPQTFRFIDLFARIGGLRRGFDAIGGKCVFTKDGAEILVRQRGKNPRHLTPRECARLMGFDKPHGSDFKIPVSDTQAYRQFGNAVVVPVAEVIPVSAARGSHAIHTEGT